MYKYCIAFLLIFQFIQPICGQERLTIDVDTFTIEMDIPANYNIEITEGFDSKIYQITRSDDRVSLIYEAAFDDLDTNLNEAIFKNLTKTNMLAINVVHTPLYAIYETTDSDFRNITGTVYLKNDTSYIRFFSFELHENYLNEFIKILSISELVD